MNHRPESRVREIRLHGSEGGETGQPVFPTPIALRHRYGTIRALIVLAAARSYDRGSDPYRPPEAVNTRSRHDGGG